jgi:hypothetical protein
MNAEDHQTLGRDEIREKLLERYTAERLDEVPTDYLETITDYAYSNAEKDSAVNGFTNSVDLEEKRREIRELRLNDVPATEDLQKIQQRSDRARLYEDRARRRMTDEEREDVPAAHETEAGTLRHLAGEEMKLRRNEEFRQLLDLEYQRDTKASLNPALLKEEDGEILYLSVTESSVQGIKFNSDEINADTAWNVFRLGYTASETMRKLEEEPERIGGFGDMTFFELTKRYKDILQKTTEDFNEEEHMGYDIDDLEETTEHYMEKSREALEFLEKTGATYFEIEGFNTPEIASLIDHLSVREGFEREIIPSFEDTDLNEEEWQKFNEKRIREDTDENNALRHFLDEE